VAVHKAAGPVDEERHFVVYNMVVQATSRLVYLPFSTSSHASVSYHLSLFSSTPVVHPSLCDLGNVAARYGIGNADVVAVPVAGKDDIVPPPAFGALLRGALVLSCFSHAY